MLVMTSQSYHDRSAHVLKPLNSEDSVVVYKRKIYVLELMLKWSSFCFCFVISMNIIYMNTDRYMYLGSKI